MGIAARRPFRVLRQLDAQPFGRARLPMSDTAQFRRPEMLFDGDDVGRRHEGCSCENANGEAGE
jgi:hypothetical protein